MLNVKKMALKMKCNIVSDFPNDYDIADEFLHGFSKDDIRSGIKNLALLLSQLFDIIIEDTDNLDSEGTVNNIGVTNIYAEIINPFKLLYCIGVYGEVNNNHLGVDGSNLSKLYKKIGGDKPLEYMHLLKEAGLLFSIDLSVKSLNLNKTGIIEIQCPHEAKTLIGLKALAVAASRTNRAIHFADVTNISRCEYRILNPAQKFIFGINDIGYLSEHDKNYFICLHDFLLANKCKCELKVNMNAYQFNYKQKGKTANLFSIWISMDKNFVRINSMMITEHPDTLLADAPETIKDAVKNGFTCLKKDDPDACNHMCIGKNLQFSFDGTEHLKCWIINFVLPVDNDAEREFVINWLKKEIE